MVTSMKADFFEKKVGVPGGALDIPVCTEAESQAIFDDISGALKLSKKLMHEKVPVCIIKVEPLIQIWTPLAKSKTSERSKKIVVYKISPSVIICTQEEKSLELR